MIGLGWRPAAFGKRLVLDDAGERVSVPPGEGTGCGAWTAARLTPLLFATASILSWPASPPSGCIPRMSCTTDNAARPKGCTSSPPRIRLPTSGGPASTNRWCGGFNMARGKSSPRCSGMSGELRNRRRGRCGTRAFQALVVRGCEWVATGEVTLPLPEEMPTAEEVSLAPAAAE